ncbi:MAG: serine protease [Phycisphaerales bacterium]
MKLWSILAGGVIGATVIGALNTSASAAVFTPSFASNSWSPIAAAGAHDDDEALYKQIMESAGPALVTIKFVLKADGDAGAMAGLADQEMEAVGMLIDGKGLIVCSNLMMGGFAAMMARGGGAAITPSDVKVFIGDETEGRKAKVLTRDTELDLAWVKLDEDSTSELKHVDMDKGATAAAGTQVYSLQRMAKFFDRALMIVEGNICGTTEKPRKLLAPSKGMASTREDLGMPVFNSAGTVIGMVVLQIPDEESRAADTAGDLGGGPMILPAADVAKATKRALEVAAANPPAEKKEEAPAEKPAEAPKTDK